MLLLSLSFPQSPDTFGTVIEPQTQLLTERPSLINWAFSILG